MVNWKIKWAVAAWLSDASAAEATYGHISTWETWAVTDMEELFRDSSFNEDIGAWDTSGVTTMRYMFNGAAAFDQDLGWCMDDDVDLVWAFDETSCESTYCGVVQGTCKPTPAPTGIPTPDPTVSPTPAPSAPASSVLHADDHASTERTYASSVLQADEQRADVLDYFADRCADCSTCAPTHAPTGGRRLRQRPRRHLRRRRCPLRRRHRQSRH